MRRNKRVWVLSSPPRIVAAVLLACSASCDGCGDGGSGGADASAGGADASAVCVGEDPPALDAGIAGLVLGPDFSDHYRVFDLGPVPGLSDKRLGGCVIKRDDFNTLLIAGDSEAEEGAIYGVPVKRNNCGHIVGFNGSASIVVQAPYIDANLLYEANGVLIFTQWNSNQISQLAPDSVSIGVTTDMATLGVPVSVSGLAFVPPSLPAAGALRTVTFPSGDWFHLATHAAGPFCSIDSATETTQLPNGPGGLAYVPQGSPGFPNQSLIAAEWSTDTVGVYEVDEQGDPLVATRRDFFSWFEKPWGAYYDPQTGDYLFLSWGTDVDRVIIVQGFAVPPPAPPPPQPATPEVWGMPLPRRARMPAPMATNPTRRP